MPEPVLTVTMACYEQPAMMEKQLQAWSEYPESFRKKLRLVVVDDGSQRHPFRPEGDLNFDLQVFRILEDKPWNQMGARNLAMKHVSGWALFLDPDMILPQSSMSLVLMRMEQVRRRNRYRLPLRHMRSGVVDETSPNCYLIHSADFWSVGGYDEDYSGHKGYSDVLLHHVLNTVRVRPIRWPDVIVDFYSGHEVEDAQVTWLDRDVRHNRGVHLRKVAEIRKMGMGRWLRKPRETLRFAWERVR